MFTPCDRSTKLIQKKSFRWRKEYVEHYRDALPMLRVQIEYKIAVHEEKIRRYGISASSKCPERSGWQWQNISWEGGIQSAASNPSLMIQEIRYNRRRKIGNFTIVKNANQRISQFQRIILKNSHLSSYIVEGQYLL